MTRVVWFALGVLVGIWAAWHEPEPKAVPAHKPLPWEGDDFTSSSWQMPEGWRLVQ